MELEKIRKVTVLGTGMMGPGIALLFARAGYEVTLWGFDQADARCGEANYRRNLEHMLQHGVITPEEVEAALSRLTITADLEEAAREADFISEAILEKLELKQDLFARLEENTHARAILTSNTSSLLPSQIAHKMKDKSRMLVAHFWNPAYLCRLVEVCGASGTSPEVIETTMAILKKVGCEPVFLKKEILGFIGNRIMHAMKREAISLVQKGIATAEDIDQVILASFGLRFANIGVLEYIDFGGLDLNADISGYLYGDLENGTGPMPLIKEMVARGDLGAKSGKGFYDWSEKNFDEVSFRRDKEFLRRLRSDNM